MVAACLNTTLPLWNGTDWRQAKWRNASKPGKPAITYSDLKGTKTMNLEIAQATPKASKVFKALYLVVSICAALIIGTIAVLAVSNGSDSTAVSRSAMPSP